MMNQVGRQVQLNSRDTLGLLEARAVKSNKRHKYYQRTNLSSVSMSIIATKKVSLIMKSFLIT